MEAACSCMCFMLFGGVFLVSFGFPSSVSFLPYSGFLFGFRFQFFLFYIRGVSLNSRLVRFLFFSKWGGIFLNLVFIPTFVKPLCCYFWVVSSVFGVQYFFPLSNLLVLALIVFI